MAKGMVGQIPGMLHSDFEVHGFDIDCDIQGLKQIEVAPPLESTASRGQGFNLGLVATLEKAEDVKVYAEHPVHQK